MPHHTAVASLPRTINKHIAAFCPSKSSSKDAHFLEVEQSLRQGKATRVVVGCTNHQIRIAHHLFKFLVVFADVQRVFVYHSVWVFPKNRFLYGICFQPSQVLDKAGVTGQIV